MDFFNHFWIQVTVSFLKPRAAVSEVKWPLRNRRFRIETATNS